MSHIKTVARACVAAICMIAVGLLTTAASITSAALPVADKMKPEEVIAKHLESIGTAEARAAAKSRIIQGNTIATFRVGGKGQAEGGSVLASTSDKSLVSIVYGNSEYPYERVGFDGKRVTVSEIRPGQRSTIGRFFMQHEELLREGLLGGTLSSAWPLLDATAKNAKLKYAGTKKVNNREAHVLKYEPRKSSGLEIRFFFDSETFQHIRTEYEQRLVQGMTSQPGQTQQQGDSITKLIEEFSDFKTEGGLSLPHAYRLQLSIESNSRRVLQDWEFTLTKFVFNQPMSDQEFDVTTSTKS
jgi:hypothetical protein